MKSYMIRPVQTEAGLGNPPTEFSTNDIEALYGQLRFAF